MLTDASSFDVFELRLSSRRRILVCLGLALLAAMPRLHALGDLSFFGDEETSGFPARALAAGGSATVPSGMEYRRALPLSALNALSANLLGLDEEEAYRASSAVLGALTVPAAFLLGEAMAGAAVGGVVAAALAGSEWHVAFSRINRMYAPFLFFFVVAAYFGWRWLAGGRTRDGALFLGLGGLALSLHQLGVSLALLPLLALLLEPCVPRRSALLGSAGALVVAAFGYNELFVGAPYDRWIDVERPASETLMPYLRVLGRSPLPSAWLGLTALVGAGTGVLAARRVRAAEPETGGWPWHLANYGLAVVAGILAGFGQLYGLALFGALHATLLVRRPVEAWRTTRRPLAAIAVLALAVAAAAAIRHGAVEGLKAATALPFPYPAYMLEQSPGFAVLLAVAVVGLAVLPGMRTQRGLRLTTAFVLVVIGGLGLISAWAPTRYYFPVYPFWLVAGSGALVAMCAVAVRTVRGSAGIGATAAVAIVVVLSGALGGHGVPQTWHTVTLAHGEPTDPLLHGVPFRPDHRTPGRALRDRLDAADLVIAEDPLQVAWYAGRADVWLRSLEDASGFLRRTSNGELRDIYVNSRLVTDRDSLERLVERVDGRVWLVTSGETAGNRSYYLEADQRAWLDSIEATLEPAVRGEDGETDLYCLNCAGVRGMPEESAGSVTDGEPVRPTDGQ